MNDYTYDLFSLMTRPMNAEVEVSSSQNSANSSNTLDEFKSLLSLMMISSMGSGLSSSGSEGMGGFNIQQMMAPLMLALMEKLLAGQVESDPETQNEAQNEAVAGLQETVTAPSVRSTPTNVPSGVPLNGRITQSSHAGHIAIDYGVPVGTKVKATMDGKVVYAGWNNEGYGNLVIVENGPFRTYYAHLSKIPVKIGQKVSAGEVVGRSGNTGNSTGPHLHYEIRKNGKQVNPSKYMN